MKQIGRLRANSRVTFTPDLWNKWLLRLNSQHMEDSGTLALKTGISAFRKRLALHDLKAKDDL